MPVSLNQSFGMMEGGLKVFARKLTDWFDESRIPSARNDKAEINFNTTQKVHLALFILRITSIHAPKHLPKKNK
jgi:hypothetical protein